MLHEELNFFKLIRYYLHTTKFRHFKCAHCLHHTHGRVQCNKFWSFDRTAITTTKIWNIPITIKLNLFPFTFNPPPDPNPWQLLIPLCHSSFAFCVLLYIQNQVICNFLWKKVNFLHLAAHFEHHSCCCLCYYFVLFKKMFSSFLLTNSFYPMDIPDFSLFSNRRAFVSRSSLSE